MRTILILLIVLSNLTEANAQRRQRRPKPIPNSEFIGVKSTGRVTPVFEIYDPHSEQELQHVKKMGFDQVILDRAPLHEQATKLGLDVVLANWWTPETKPEIIDSMFELAKKVAPGKLAGISVMDEPERNSPDTPFSFYVDLYQKLKPRMTGPLQDVGLEISYWGPLVSWDQRYYDYFAFLYEAADVMRLMPYPDLHEDPLADVYLMMQRSKRAMSYTNVDIPHVVILQAWILPPENKLPEIDELRIMAYQVMLGGADVLSFFEYKPEVWNKTPGFTEGFEGLMKELVELRRNLEGAKIETYLDEDLLLHASASWEDGQVANLRVNTNRFEAAGMPPLSIEDSELQAIAQANRESLLATQQEPAYSRACALLPCESCLPKCPPCQPKICSKNSKRRGLFSRLFSRRR